MIISVEWVPRKSNVFANEISKTLILDDWSMCVYILIGWTSDGDRIQLMTSFVLLMKTTFVYCFILYIGVEGPPMSTPLVINGAKITIGSLLLSAF